MQRWILKARKGGEVQPAMAKIREKALWKQMRLLAGGGGRK